MNNPTNQKLPDHHTNHMCFSETLISYQITNASGRQCEVPSVCFVIPAPDVEATEVSTR